MYVKISQADGGRPHGRRRVRVLHDATNRIVSYPNGRARYFNSDDEADTWIDLAERDPQAAEAALRPWEETKAK